MKVIFQLMKIIFRFMKAISRFMKVILCNEKSGLPKLLRWSHALCLDQYSQYVYSQMKYRTIYPTGKYRGNIYIARCVSIAEDIEGNKSS
jgi:hypothetical protein